MGLIWGTVISVLGMVGAILLAVASRLICEDVKEWLPWITRRLIEQAVNRLPEKERERFKEEWWGHVNETPGQLAKLYVAYGYLSASKAINNIVSSKGPAFAERAQEAIRRVKDIVIAAMLLFFYIPLFVIVALCIRAESKGPVFVWSLRIGRNGRTFRLLKFRSMYVDLADSSALNTSKDPRITRVGSFLRRTNLDELPKLLSVLRGDMTLVGPMPLDPMQAAARRGKPDTSIPGLFQPKRKVKLGKGGHK